jgi:peptidoglycan/LPS O-acetylase OafA/YrhL
MFRMIGAIAAGYLTMSLLTMLAVNNRAKTLGERPDQTPSDTFMLLTLACSTLFAVMGGAITASLAKPPRFKAAMVMASLTFIMALIYVFSSLGGVQPWWYLLGLLVFGPPAVTLGGYLRARNELKSSAPGDL